MSQENMIGTYDVCGADGTQFAVILFREGNDPAPCVLVIAAIDVEKDEWRPATPAEALQAFKLAQAKIIIDAMQAVKTALEEVQLSRSANKLAA